MTWDWEDIFNRLLALEGRVSMIEAQEQAMALALRDGLALIKDGKALERTEVEVAAPPPEPEESPEARLDRICATRGLRVEDVTLEPNEGYDSGYQWSAWVGEYEYGARVGTGATPDAAIEDLMCQMDEVK